MAIYTKKYGHVSFDASELMRDLEEDMEEFGKDAEVQVIACGYGNATIYKHYAVVGEDAPLVPDKDKGERVEKMTTAELMEEYRKEDSIL